MDRLNAAILICSVTTAPADCQPNTALDVLVAPDATSYILCGLQSQAYVAASALGANLGKDRYLKLLCTRKRLTATAEWPPE